MAGRTGEECACHLARQGRGTDAHDKECRSQPPADGQQPSGRRPGPRDAPEDQEHRKKLPAPLSSVYELFACRGVARDPEEFYEAAVECVKGCLNAVRGQGRYLMVAFPEEMKDIKAGIDAIGREINVMTKAIGRFKDKSSRLRRHAAHPGRSPMRGRTGTLVCKGGADERTHRREHRAP